MDYFGIRRETILNWGGNCFGQFFIVSSSFAHLYLCRALENLHEEEPSVTAVLSPSWTTLPYSAGAASHPQAGTTSSCRQSLTLPTLPLRFISHCASLECSSSYAKYDIRLQNQCAYLHSRNAHHQQANMFLHFVMVLVLYTITKCATDFYLKLYTKIMRSLEMCTFTSAE